MKTFRQKSYTLIFLWVLYKSFYCFFTVVLHYKIIPAYKIWHTYTVSGVIKQVETQTTEVCFSDCNFEISATLSRYSSLLTKGKEKWKYGNSRERLERKFFVLYNSPWLFHWSCKIIISFLWSQSKACIKIEKQLNCKKCVVGLCILRCFEEYHTKARFC